MNTPPSLSFNNLGGIFVSCVGRITNTARRNTAPHNWKDVSKDSPSKILTSVLLREQFRGIHTKSSLICSSFQDLRLHLLLKNTVDATQCFSVNNYVPLIRYTSSSKNFLMRRHLVAFAKCSGTVTKRQRRERSLLSTAFYLFICLLLLWKNTHNTKFTVSTIFKYTIEWHYVHSHCRATIIILFQKFFALQNLNSAPVKQQLPISLSSQMLAPALGTSYQWNQTVFFLWCLAPFTRHNVFKAHPGSTICQNFIPLYGYTTFCLFIQKMLMDIQIVSTF